MARFNLPVFKPTTPTTPQELFRRAMHTEEIHAAALGAPQSFDFGQAILSEEFPLLPNANQIRDVTLTPDLTAEQIVAQVDAAFAARKLICQRWHFEAGKIPPQFKSILEPRGYSIRPADLWLMKQPCEFPTPEDLTIIPGRASFQKLAELAEAAETKWGTTNPDELAQLCEEPVRLLDDPRIDNLLALKEQTPVGAINLVTNGETGLITDLYVHPDHLRKHIASALLMHILELAARSRIRHLMLFCRPDNTPAKSLYQKAGFTHIYSRESLRLMK